MTIEPNSIHFGDCLDIMPAIPDESIDAIITDPPYELGFMNHGWDKSGIAFNTQVWSECLRVLKPGGYLLCFTGTRTGHRVACAIEDAEFIIRDEIVWVYREGLLKSLSIDRAIDSSDAKSLAKKNRLKFTAWMRGAGLRASEIDRITNSQMSSHYLTPAGQPAIPIRSHFEKLRPYIKINIPNWVEKLVDERTIESENVKKRKIVGKKNRPSDFFIGNSSDRKIVDITEPYTEEARSWNGYGTSLVPGHENIIMAMKPLNKKTFADNALSYGTGVVNLKACKMPVYNSDEKRFPANVAMTGNFSDEYKYRFDIDRWYKSVVQFPKASQVERHAGCEGLEKSGSEITGREPDSAGIKNPRAGTGRGGAGNFHPTVKPIALLAWLVNLVARPGCLVLDPFGGSGSTAIACIQSQVDYILIEKEKDYVKIARRRIKAEMEQPWLIDLRKEVKN